LVFIFSENIKNNMFATIIRIFVTTIEYGKANLLANWSIVDILRMTRNVFLILINGYSPIIPLVMIAFIFYWVKNKKWPEMIFLFSILIPFFLTAKFWYGGLYGRYSSFIGYGLALLVGLILNKKVYWLIIISIFVVFIPTLIAYQQIPYPQIQKQLIEQIKLSKNDVIVLSDYQRPQLTYTNGLYINGDQNEQKNIENKIHKALQDKQRVFISEQAITFPYFQYDGQQIHIISKGDKNKAVIKKFLKNKKLILVSENKAFPFLNIYQFF